MSSKREILLVPVDFKEHSLKSIEYARILSAQLKAEIHLMHVLDIEDWWVSSYEPEDLMNESFSKLLSLSKRHDLPESTVFRVLRGKRYERILGYARAVNPRFILMTDNYPDSTETKKIGSTLSRIIIEAKHPVITVKSTPGSIFKNILVPLDLTKDCRLKLFNSIALALSFGATLHIVTVVFGDIAFEESRLKEKIEKYKKFYDENQIKYTVTILSKDEEYAYREILDKGAELGCDSILIMTHREAVTIDNYLGAFAHHIINESKLPVVSINNASSQVNYSSFISRILDPLGLLSK